MSNETEVDIKKILAKNSGTITFLLFLIGIGVVFVTGRGIVIDYKISQQNQTCVEFGKAISNASLSNASLGESNTSVSCNCFYQQTNINDTKLEELSENYCTCDCKNKNGTARINVRVGKHVQGTAVK